MQSGEITVCICSWILPNQNLTWREVMWFLVVKRTKLEENIESIDRNSQIAKKLAVHLVSQVLDEACIILNSAKDLGEPWQGITEIKNESLYDESDKKNSTFVIDMGDNDDVKVKQECAAMATSTPQKNTEEIKSNHKTDAFIIGQGDEETYFEQDTLQIQEQSELCKSTSNFINRLFDMSDVEYIPDEYDITQKNVEINDFTMDEATNIITFCLESAFILAYKNETAELNNLNSNTEMSPSSDHSSYSFLDDALSSDFVKNIAFYVDVDVPTNSKHEPGHPKYSVFEEEGKKEVIETIETKDVAFYESTYVTLNRDYEQYSDEGEFISQDSKSLKLQDVELCDKTSSVHLPAMEKMDNRDLASTSVAPASAVSRKSNLVRRCRLQGARLFSCLRGWWWRRKLPGSHKEPRVPGSVRGQCPLSPSVRLRASSLLDHRFMRTPSPSRPIVWKFNTINETMVNSARWNEYSYQSPTETADYQ